MAAGGIIPGLGGQPAPRPDQQYRGTTGQAIAPGSTNVFRGRLVVIFGTGPNVGLFVYSPKPGAGNLVASIAAAAGTDPYGNSYLAGVVSYGASGLYTQALAGALNFAPALFSSNVVQLSSDAFGELVLNSPNPTAGQSPSLFTVAPGTNTEESWHSMNLVNGWANRGGTFVTAQYRRVASPPNDVRIIGDVSGGTITNGTILATLPVGYQPASAQSVGVQGALGTTAHSALDPVIEAETNGQLKLFNVGAGTTSISFNGSISLDA